MIPTAAPGLESQTKKDLSRQNPLCGRVDRGGGGRQGPRVVGGRRRSLWRRPAATHSRPRPRIGICVGDRVQPARAHPCRPDPCRCTARDDPGAGLAETLRRRRRSRSARVLLGLDVASSRMPSSASVCAEPRCAKITALPPSFRATCTATAGGRFDLVPPGGRRRGGATVRCGPASVTRRCGYDGLIWPRLSVIGVRMVRRLPFTEVGRAKGVAGAAVRGDSA